MAWLTAVGAASSVDEAVDLGTRLLRSGYIKSLLHKDSFAHGSDLFKFAGETPERKQFSTTQGMHVEQNHKHKPSKYVKHGVCTVNLSDFVMQNHHAAYTTAVSCGPY